MELIIPFQLVTNMPKARTSERKPVSMFVDSENMALALDLYELTMAAAYFDNDEFHEATFELFVRNFPKDRSYLLAAGLEQVVQYLLNVRFNDSQIKFLKAHPSFKHVSKAFFNYLRRFRFTGDVWAVPEGTVVFTNEPILRVTAPVIEAQIVETYLLSTINFQTLIATKASRVVQAAKGREIIEFGSRRAHGPEAGVLAARASYIGGCIGSSNVLADYEFGVPSYGTIAHSFVMNFDSEKEAFQKYCKVFPEHSTLLIDTYDTIQGAKNAIDIGLRPVAVRLDSGDLYDLSVQVRKILDDAGFKDTRILASGDLNEYLIEELVSKGARIDAFGVGTELSTSRDDPALSGIYKLVSIKKNGKPIQRMKLSRGKKTIPGSKQIYRFYSQDGKLKEDILALESEPSPEGSIPLLVKVIERGKLIYDLPSLGEIRERAGLELNRLPDSYKRLRISEEPPVRLSQRLEQLLTLPQQSS